MDDRIVFPAPPGFVPGEAVGIVGPCSVALVQADPRSPLVAAIWEVVRTGSPFDDLTETIAAHGVRSLPSMTVVALEGDRLRCLVRGGMQVNLCTAVGEADVQVLAADVTTWREHVAHDVESAELLVAGDLTELGIFQVAAGIVPAARIAVRVSGSGFAEQPIDDERGEAELVGVPGEPDIVDVDVEVDGGDVVGPVRVAEARDVEVSIATCAGDPSSTASDLSTPSVDAEGAIDQDSLPERVADDSDAPVLDRSNLTIRFDDDTPDAPSVAAEPEGGAQLPSAGELDRSGVPDTDDYDHLFGATQYRPLSEAGAHPPVESDIPLAPSTDQPEMVISAVPSSSAPDPAAPGESDSEGDHDGMTISLAQLRSARGEKPADSGPLVRSNSGAPTVHAVECSSGHLNPTSAVTCRVCELEIPEQAHVSVQRPLLGTFEFSFGLAQPVVRSMLLGRSPVAKGPVSGELPELVTLPSPSKELSGTHLEIRLDGWQVSVVDRQSTNGTTVQLPGRDPQRLHPDEPFPIVPGAVIDLAGEVQFTYAAPTD